MSGAVLGLRCGDLVFIHTRGPRGRPPGPVLGTAFRSLGPRREVALGTPRATREAPALYIASLEGVTLDPHPNSRDLRSGPEPPDDGVRDP